MSGQKINLDKSSVQFGHKISDSRRTELHATLGIKNVGGMGSYLGLPESLGGSKCKIFAYLRERIQKRTTGWSSNLLSKGGKEILIKSVLTAMPTYVMSCFRLPKGVTTKITSVVAQFWWSSNGRRRGMHWKKWEKMCRKKCDGGLGFRVIEDFNTALLAKQLWRLINVPDSLFARVFKGRYYRNSDPLDGLQANSPSYGWRSITSAFDLVRWGAIKRIGTGEATSVWYDNWIPDVIPRPARGPGSQYYPYLTVNELIDHSSRKWNVPLLTQLFSAEDVSLICGLAINTQPRSDMWYWHFTKSGKYTVKSGYDIEYERNTQEINPLFGPDVRIIQANSWKIQCPPKIQHFLWQITSGCISVQANLRSRGLNCDPVCVRCGEANETIQHVLFECPPAVQTWALSCIPTPPSVFPSQSLFANMDHLFWRLSSNKDFRVYPWLLWYIWKARNDKIFNNIDVSPMKIVEIAGSEANAWFQAQEEEEERLGNNDPTPSVPGTLPVGHQCFIDGSWKKTDYNSGLGWYSLSMQNEVLLGSKRTRRCLSPLHTELEALLWAMECMLNQHHLSVIFLTDSSELLHMISSPQDWPAFQSSTDIIMQLKARFQSCSFVKIARESNGKADSLARQARVFSSDLSYVGSTFPAWYTEPI